MINPDEITEEDIREAQRTLRDNGYETVRHYGNYTPKFDGADFQEYLKAKVSPKVDD